MDKIKELKIRAGQQILMKYTLPDCLKPEYDGMLAKDIVAMILDAADEVELQAKSEMRPDKQMQPLFPQDQKDLEDMTGDDKNDADFLVKDGESGETINEK